MPCAARRRSSQASAGFVLGIVAAQAVRELHREGIRHPRLPGRVVRQIQGQPCRVAAGVPHPVGEIVGRLPRRRVVHHQFGDAPQVLDQDDAQDDRPRPKLADRQRLHRLIGDQIATQHLEIEMAVGVGHQRPCRAEHPRQALERAGVHLRQLRVKTRRQVDADLADLHVDQMVVVRQPLGGRRCVMAVFGRLGQSAVGLQQERGVIGQASGQLAVTGAA